ncbi:MAG: NAD(P)H-hydrate dehydratase [Kiritimatiellaeota bacterium]|nr:NAD(P)H-hydrate dehydratase [Kiritimatiellota bacterium]
MKLVSAAQMREMDRRAMEEFNISGEELMDRAGEGVAEVVERLAEAAGYQHPFIHLIAGRGNNGGDVFAAAFYLEQRECDVEIWLAGAKSEIQGDALKHLSRARQAEIPLVELPTKEDWDQARPLGADLLVDGVLGIGASGPARGPAVGAIQYINACSRAALVVALDVPSGLDADTGLAEGEVVVADVTATIGLPKLGLVEPSALEYVGAVEVVDIGIPAGLVAELVSDSDRELIYRADFQLLLPRRARVAHKGRFGHVLLIGGARGYAGAIALAARAASRAGAGLVTVVTPAGIAPIVAGAALEGMICGAAETGTGSLSADTWKEFCEPLAEELAAVLLGPGLTRNAESLELVRNVLRACKAPLVLDADALAVLAGQPEWLGRARCPVVITPHPGEMAALFDQTVEKVQAGRCGMAIAAAKFCNATVVLKGAGTVVAQTGRPTAINLTGNPGMATGGAGDVLAGILTALLGQGLAPYDAARLAVYLHGRAGDMVAWRKSQAGLIAGDLVDELPFAFRDIATR